MLKLKFENLLLVLIVLSAGYLGSRYFKRPPTAQNAAQDVGPSETSHNQQPQPISSLPSPIKKDAATSQPPSSNGGTPASKMVKYKELLKDPMAGLERLSLLEQMKAELSQDEITDRFYYEIINNGPAIKRSELL